MNAFRDILADFDRRIAYEFGETYAVKELARRALAGTLDVRRTGDRAMLEVIDTIPQDYVLAARWAHQGYVSEARDLAKAAAGNYWLHPSVSRKRAMAAARILVRWMRRDALPVLAAREVA